MTLTVDPLIIINKLIEKGFLDQVIISKDEMIYTQAQLLKEIQDILEKQEGIFPLILWSKTYYCQVG